MIVYHPANNLFETIVDFMDKDFIDHVRLSDSGLQNLIRNEQMFHPMQGYYYMSVISAVWRTSKLLELYTRYSTHTYRTIESEEVQRYVSSQYTNYYISSPYDVEHLPLHALSWHFPSIHVTHFGKWCVHSKMNLYYVHKLLDTYTIDIHKRGVFTH